MKYYKYNGAERKFGAIYVAEELLLAYVMNDSVSDNSLLYGIDLSGNALWKDNTDIGGTYNGSDKN